MTEQDSVVANQSNHTEDDDYEHVKCVKQTEPVSRSRSNSSVGRGTRDQDEVIAKSKGSTLEDVREDMNELRKHIRDLAADNRRIPPDPDPDE